VRKPEQRLADRVRRSIGHLVLIERIENVAGLGTPDACVLAQSGSARGGARVTWTEHKVATEPAKVVTRLQYAHPLTTEQKNWHLRWTSRGGNSLILIGCEGRLFAVPGTLADRACEYTFAEAAAHEVDYDELVKIYRNGFRV
jgi:hypothetical protein